MSVGLYSAMKHPSNGLQLGKLRHGAVKRDLAAASVKPLPEQGGVFSPPAAPLHPQEHVSSLQQLARGYMRETLLLHILPVL